jgi:hypothetical protein
VSALATFGFSADSAYATWCAGERDASDRMEALYNHDRRCVIADTAGHPITTQPDGLLRSLAKTYRRRLEDHEDGSHVLAKGHLRVVRVKLRDVEREQTYRAALAESWLAAEGGTHCYSAFQARGGLGAVLHDGAIPPTYELARLLDLAHWKQGFLHVLDWGKAKCSC